MGKQTDTTSDAGWGTVQILIYPAGTEIPPNKQTQAGYPIQNNLRPTGSGFRGRNTETAVEVAGKNTAQFGELEARSWVSGGTPTTRILTTE